MDRRTILKQLGMAATAAVLLPSCIGDTKRVSIALNSLEISGEEEELLAEIADTIIPQTDKPGAKTVGAHLFALVMVDDCMEKSRQHTYLKGLREFNRSFKNHGRKTFSASSPEERLKLLTYLEENRDTFSDETGMFYFTSKRYIVQGYQSSKYYLTEVKPYLLVPGPNFQGCVPVSSNSKLT